MRWTLRTTDPGEAAALADSLRAIPALEIAESDAGLLAHLLLLRGIGSRESAEQFLNPSISGLHSPYLMTGMSAAVERLCAAIARKEQVLIYGDYDVDGTTAVVILKTAIELCGGGADFHVPHRIRDGYDMRGDVIERAAAAGVTLIISVDMGIRAFAPAETARRLGVDLIVTDHHLPGHDGVPQAFAVLNPNQAGCQYPCKSLCGAGVAFKLAQALIEKLRAGNDLPRLLTSFTKMVAIATVADAVPLAGENRIFAKLGLEALRRAVNPGLKALLEVSQLGGRPLTAGEVAFRIAPRINAAGRMDIARDVIELFSTKDPAQARGIANKLDRLNSERQEEERRIMESILQRCDEDRGLADAYCMVIDGDGWHRGVIGITATRVVERFGRPALVISRDGEEAHGSGRSIRAFHLLNALESCGELFTRFGGHAHAVGFSLPCSRIAELRSRLDQHAREKLTPADFEPVLNIDGALPLDRVSPQFFRVLRQMEPFGVGNPEPVFTAQGARLTAPPRIMKDKHVKLKLSQPEGSETDAKWKRAVSFNAMGWRMAERFQQQSLLMGDQLDIAFTLDYNEHPEFGGLELGLRDFQAAVSRTRTQEAAATSTN